MIPPGAIVKRKRDEAEYRVGSAAADGARFLTTLSPDAWPSLWEDAETLSKDYELVSLPCSVSEAEARAALTTGAQREHVRAYVREQRSRTALADELGYEPDELPRDRPGMWTSVPFEAPQ